MTITFELRSSIELQLFSCLEITLGWINQNWAGRIQNTWAHMKKNQRHKLCFACQSVYLDLSC